MGSGASASKSQKRYVALQAEHERLTAPEEAKKDTGDYRMKVPLTLKQLAAGERRNHPCEHCGSDMGAITTKSGITLRCFTCKTNTRPPRPSLGTGDESSGGEESRRGSKQVTDPMSRHGSKQSMDSRRGSKQGVPDSRSASKAGGRSGSKCSVSPEEMQERLDLALNGRSNSKEKREKRHAEREHERKRWGFEVDDVVTWSFQDSSVPRGTRGTIVGFTETEVRVKFPSSIWPLPAKDLKKVEQVHGQEEPAGGKLVHRGSLRMGGRSSTVQNDGAMPEGRKSSKQKAMGADMPVGYNAGDRVVFEEWDHTAQEFGIGTVVGPGTVAGVVTVKFDNHEPHKLFNLKAEGLRVLDLVQESALKAHGVKAVKKRQTVG